MDAFFTSFPFLLHGLLLTLFMSAAAILCATVIGLLGGLALEYGPAPTRVIARLYVDVVRGVPLLVLIFAVYYMLPVLGIQVNAVAAGIIALSIFGGAHVTEDVRGGLSSVPRGQMEAAKAIGLTFWKRLRRVILPQAIRRVIPPWVNTAVELVKGSSLVSLIGAVDLLLATQEVTGRTFIVIPTYAAAATLYFVVNYGLSMAAGVLERRYAYFRY